MDIATQSRFTMAYTYQYSKRPGTPAAEMENQVPKDVAQERYERLIEHVNAIAWQENKKQIGKTVEVLVGNHEGRKDSQTNRLSGRARDSRLVHFELPAGEAEPRPGDLVTVTATDAKPYFLLADQPTAGYSIVPTRAGDAYDALEAASCAVDSSAAKGVSIGLPSLKRK
jgi:tRNA-2-methylthio-N6-dimethylallyladenosine synthase